MRRIHGLPVLLAAAALAGAGCGGDGGDGGSGGSGGSSGPPSGAELFASQGCGSCHTLAAADAGGVTGPNLDELKPSFAAAREQIENGGGGMPAFGDELTPAQMDAIARYVSEEAGK